MQNVESYHPDKKKSREPSRGFSKPRQHSHFGIKNDPKIILKTTLYVTTSIILVGCLIVGAYGIIRWRAEKDVLDEQIADIQNNTSINEITTEATTDNSIPASDPYWGYVNLPLMSADLTTSIATNPETVGWIQVPGTNINYPFVKTKDNDFYLNHSFNRAWNSAGWIFLDYRNDPNLSDKNQILYGHGRTDGSMFGSLANILTADWQSHSEYHIVKTSTKSTNSLWQVFSVYDIPVTSDYLTTNFVDASEFTNFLTLIKNRSAYDFHATLNPSDRIITLSTCSGTDHRIVLHAKLIKTVAK